MYRYNRASLPGDRVKALMLEASGGRVVVRPGEGGGLEQGLGSVPPGSLMVSIDGLSTLTKPAAQFIASVRDLPATAPIPVTFLAFPR